MTPCKIGDVVWIYYGSADAQRVDRIEIISLEKLERPFHHNSWSILGSIITCDPAFAASFVDKERALYHVDARDIVDEPL